MKRLTFAFHASVIVPLMVLVGFGQLSGQGLVTGLATQGKTTESGLYFPPHSGVWETVEPESAGWNPGDLETALEIAGQNNSTAIVILHRGRILAERYRELSEEARENSPIQFSVGADAASHPIEDVASIQKNIVSFLTGMAVERGLLDIDRPVSELLGEGWSKAVPDMERRITVRHIITMTSGLDDELRSQVPPGEDWIYSGAYKMMIPILKHVTGMDMQTLTRTWLTESIGMKDSRWTPRSWAADVPRAAPIGFATSARDAARFGLLVLAGGEWNGVQILGKSAVAEMLHPSQEHNPSYGLLWWLNGNAGPRKDATMFRFIWGHEQGPIINTAPDDLVVASGYNARRIYIVPSLEMVVVRLGEAPLTSEGTEPSESFDDKLWGALMKAVPASDRNQKNEKYIWKNLTEDVILVRIDTSVVRKFVPNEFELYVDESSKAHIAMINQKNREYLINGENLGQSDDVFHWIRIVKPEDQRDIPGTETTLNTFSWYAVYSGSTGQRVRESWKSSGVHKQPIQEVTLMREGDIKSGRSILSDNKSYNWRYHTFYEPTARFTGINHDLYQKGADGKTMLHQVRAVLDVTGWASPAELIVKGMDTDTGYLPEGTYNVAVHTFRNVWATVTVGKVVDERREDK